MDKNFSLDDHPAMDGHELAANLKHHGIQNKHTKYLKRAADKIYEMFDGEITDDPDLLQNIYGVGQKLVY